jgi:ribA/ribD-fused uncharacterized protein
MKAKTIRFYSINGPYGDFSNLARFPIRLNGLLWSSVEHFFQAQKFAGTSLENEIRKTRLYSQAAKIGRNRRNKIRPDWKSSRVELMRKALKAKFTQHPDLKLLLLSTKDAVLIEHSEKDSFWADGGNGSGKNMLGHLLMEIRAELFKKE